MRSDSAGSLLDVHSLQSSLKEPVPAAQQQQQPPYMMRQRMQAQQQGTSCKLSSSPHVPVQVAGSKPSMSHACSAASLQQQGAGQTPGGNTPASSTDAAASLTGSSCSSSSGLSKFSKEQYCTASGSPSCGAAAAAAASISVTAMAGAAAVESCGVHMAGGERLYDRAMGPFAAAAGAATVAAGGTGGAAAAAAAVAQPMYCHVQQSWVPGGGCAGVVHAPHSPFGPYAVVPGAQQCACGFCQVASMSLLDATPASSEQHMPD